MVFMPPRTGKSSLASLLFPSFYMGNYPGDHLMAISYTNELTKDWGYQIRSMVKSDEYRTCFTGFKVLADRSAVHNWWTNFNGRYFAGSITGGIAGRGFHLGIIDDPLSEQDYMSDTAVKFVNERWFGPGFYTRRNPQRNAIIIMSTRWRSDDLPGFLLKNEGYSDFADKYHIVDIPAILDKSRATVLNKWAGDPRLTPPRKIKHKAGGSFAPRRMPLKELLRTKGQPGMTDHMWNALYMQKPTGEAGLILKREHWRKWEEKQPPEVDFLMQVYDTAFEEGEENDFSARTTWGVFLHADKPGADERWNCILLEAWRDRIAFPDLRVRAKEDFDKYEPDKVIIEKKASGHSLVQELRRKGVPVLPFIAERYLGGRLTKRSSKSKTGRAHVASTVLAEGVVWYMPRAWAEEVITECADFPLGDHDDWVDTCVIAWLYLRKTFRLEFGSEGHRPEPAPPMKEKRFYG